MLVQALEYAMENFHGTPYKKDGYDKEGIGSCHLVHLSMKAVGIDMPFWNTEGWNEKDPGKYGFKKVSTPERGDIVVFAGHIGFYMAPGMVYISSIRAGVSETETCWFGKVVHYYHYDP